MLAGSELAVWKLAYGPACAFFFFVIFFDSFEEGLALPCPLVIPTALGEASAGGAAAASAARTFAVVVAPALAAAA